MEPKLLLIVPAIFGNLHAEKSYLLYRVKAPTAQIGNLTLIEETEGLDVIYLQASQVGKSTVALVAASNTVQFENKLERRRINFISKGSTLVQRATVNRDRMARSDEAKLNTVTDQRGSDGPEQTNNSNAASEMGLPKTSFSSSAKLIRLKPSTDPSLCVTLVRNPVATRCDWSDPQRLFSLEFGDNNDYSFFANGLYLGHSISSVVGSEDFTTWSAEYFASDQLYVFRVTNGGPFLTIDEDNRLDLSFEENPSPTEYWIVADPSK